jgi:hypothetical protein
MDVCLSDYGISTARLMQLNRSEKHGRPLAPGRHPDAYRGSDRRVPLLQDAPIAGDSCSPEQNVSSPESSTLETDKPPSDIDTANPEPRASDDVKKSGTVSRAP